ncbi:MAG TPA: RNA polymerase sigma factor [Candidatus Paceibacterota bacterium]|nr:RNA polymerase sigma factor [Candidatus Paceibacterota bacterium]HPT17958.1 RNA polymerase sigma factor [Candidatus Paceibacterota bacterium]
MYHGKKEITDEDIAILVQQGDKEKFGLLIERYNDKLSRYGRKFLSRKENIDDIVQDIFINTYQSIQNYDPSFKFSSWIYRIAHNAFINGLKKQFFNPINYFDFDTLISHQVYEDPEERERETKELKKIIDSCLDTLEPKYKEVIILHYIEDFSYKEISDILKIPTGTVGVRIKRGKESLKKAYNNIEEKNGKR